MLARWRRRRRPERIDPFGVGEPWRHHVRGALQAQARYDQTVAGLPDGPLRERLSDIGRRIEEATRECWRIAQRGHALDDAVSALDVAAVRRRLAARADPPDGPDPVAGGEDPVLASLQAQLAAATRLTAVAAGAQEHLGLVRARLDEAVAAALALSALANDLPDTGRLEVLGGEIDLVVEDLAALSSALEETRTLD